MTKSSKAAPPRATGRADTSTRVYELIRQRAINYELRPEERINEVEMAAEMRCSRTPVREALNRLVVEGLVTFIPNKGFYCRAFDTAEILHLFEVRGALEAKSVALACARGAGDGLAAIRDGAEDMLGRAESLPIEELTRNDEEFHIRIAELTGNGELARLLEGINARIRFVRRIEIENRGAKAFAEHAQIAAALAERDAARAGRLMQEHIEISVADAVATVKEGLARIYMRKHSA
jgi:DNA-binding GntR family transcriptional regulator